MKLKRVIPRPGQKRPLLIRLSAYLDSGAEPAARVVGLHPRSGCQDCCNTWRVGLRKKSGANGIAAAGARKPSARCGHQVSAAAGVRTAG